MVTALANWRKQPEKRSGFRKSFPGLFKEHGVIADTYLTWELETEQRFACLHYPEDRRVRAAVCEFTGFASIWWSVIGVGVCLGDYPCAPRLVVGLTLRRRQF